MAIGLGVLRLPPQAFWSMTTVELAAAIDGLRGRPSPLAAAPLTRAELLALMERFPDTP
jgi:uncharacterized phage protein (TIGR02216 family)